MAEAWRVMWDGVEGLDWTECRPVECATRRLISCGLCRPSAQPNDDLRKLPTLVIDGRIGRLTAKVKARAPRESPGGGCALRQGFTPWQLTWPSYNYISGKGNNYRSISTLNKEAYKSLSARKILHKEYALGQWIKMRANVRLLCLAEVPPDAPEALLLWGHYSDSHRGFVIEFDESHPWIKSHERGPGRTVDCNRVIYSDKRYSLLPDKDGNINPGPDVRDYLFTKSLHWKYESEYRLVRFVGDKGLDASRGIDSLVKFPPEAIRSITVGLEAKETLVNRLTDACNAKQFSHVALKRAYLHPDKFAITLQKLK